MKTTLEIKDDLLVRAKLLAKRTGRTLSVLVEDSLRSTLAVAEEPARYKVPDLSYGDEHADDPLERVSWQVLRAEVYGEPLLK